MPAARQAEINALTLVVTGDQEIAGLKRAGTAMVDQIITAKAVTIGDAGHVVNLEQPGEFNDAVRKFLETYG